MLYDNVSINEKGHLTFAGRDTVELAQKYGTPLYLMDETKIRERMRTYKNALSDLLPQGSVPEYASKAFSCRRIYEIAAEEGIDIDVVSCGEIYTAKTAGFPMERCLFHGNNKSDANIEFAMEQGVGFFVADSIEELYAINEIAGEKGITQKILIRITPGIDPHTHKKISTGSVESKFGIAIQTGQAMEAVCVAITLENIELCGFHCHIGSQIFESEPFCTAAQIMLDFIVEVREKCGYIAEILNLGGGFGVRYVESDPVIDYREKISEVAEMINGYCERLSLPVPKIKMEPGRSMVADCGMTLYTVGSVKELAGYKNYISIDGGMTDNPRYTLYEAEYTVYNASHADKSADFVATLAGCCCESGDIIGENLSFAKPVRGDIIAVLTTGAYNYSMASNYNRLPRPPVVMLDGEKDYIAVRRETYSDICSLDE